MRAPLNPTLRHIGERLQREGEDTVQTPMPWAFLDRLCRLDEVEEAATRKADDAERDRLKWLLRAWSKAEPAFEGTRIMTRDKLVRTIANDAQKRAAILDSVDVRLAYLREAEAVLESIQAAGWTVVPEETAQALDDSAVLDSLARLNDGK